MIGWIFIASFAVGVGGTGWTLQSEVFPHLGAAHVSTTRCRRAWCDCCHCGRHDDSVGATVAVARPERYPAHAIARMSGVRRCRRRGRMLGRAAGAVE